jgi:hypothetical protein
MCADNTESSIFWEFLGHVVLPEGGDMIAVTGNDRLLFPHDIIPRWRVWKAGRGAVLRKGHYSRASKCFSHWGTQH